MTKIDLAKRRRVMQASQKMGHCICDPRRPCPCDVFTGKGLCPCAGERPAAMDMSQVRLTEMVRNAGCASKIAASDLESVLGRLPAVTDPCVISGLAAADDAGIYALDPLTLVQTVDVFTPCVDDPYAFGRICAANCLSDIYAMGGVPRTALSILAFPSETLDGEIMYQMLKGAMDVLAAAGVALIGGHSIKDEEIKLGFAITGTVQRDRASRHDTAQVGDALLLTKPLGVGVLNFCRQIGRSVEAGMAQAQESMAALNKDAAEAMNAVGASACTDITGFGLFGHLVSLARHSQVTVQVFADALPAFDGALAALSDGVITGAIERNREYVGDDIAVGANVEEARVLLGFDAQTSGGLLICVPQQRLAALRAELTKRGIHAPLVGRITEKSTGRIVVASSTAQPFQAAPPASPSPYPSFANSSGVALAKPEATEGGPLPSRERGEDTTQPRAAGLQGEGSAGCCAGGAAATADAPCCAGPATAPAGASGVDARVKQLINFSLALLGRCDSCFAVHYDKAIRMGISQVDLDEAAGCAVVMGGALVRMFYLEQLKKHG